LNEQATRKRVLGGLVQLLARFDLPECFIFAFDEEGTIVQNEKKIHIVPCWK
jgi:hypothetical protein